MRSSGLHALVIGAGGMLGSRLAKRLVADGCLASRELTTLSLVDLVTPRSPASESVGVFCKNADLSNPGVAASLIATRPDIIFHLAAIVSGEAEADFERGYRVNLDGTRLLFEAIRAQGALAPYCPRVVFASSLAVFGAPLPDVVPDDLALSPLTSYGTQKAICELLLADYSRRGFLDGVGLRLPTICIRPGAANRAARGFLSNILREPLAGREAILPVPDTVRHWHASPRAGVGFLLHAAAIDTASLGARRSLSLPGLSATVGDQLDALRRVAGDAALRLVRREPDPTIERIVAGWPRAFEPRRALALGFQGDASFDAIIRQHLEDESEFKFNGAS